LKESHSKPAFLKESHSKLIRPKNLITLCLPKSLKNLLLLKLPSRESLSNSSKQANSNPLTNPKIIEKLD